MVKPKTKTSPSYSPRISLQPFSQHKHFKIDTKKKNEFVNCENQITSSPVYSKYSKGNYYEDPNGAGLYIGNTMVYSVCEKKSSGTSLMICL